MTAPTRTTNPLRAKALGYLRDGRVVVRAALLGTGADHGSTHIFAIIYPAAGDRSGISVRCDVRLYDGVWGCDEHPGENSCSHRLAVQMVTGWGHLGGGWAAVNADQPERKPVELERCSECGEEIPEGRLFITPFGARMHVWCATDDGED